MKKEVSERKKAISKIGEETEMQLKNRELILQRKEIELQQRESQNKLQRQADHDRAPRHRAAVLADRPGKPDHHDEAEASL